jgi:hypothetical protein
MVHASVAAGTSGHAADSEARSCRDQDVAGFNPNRLSQGSGADSVDASDIRLGDEFVISEPVPARMRVIGDLTKQIDGATTARVRRVDTTGVPEFVATLITN